MTTLQTEVPSPPLIDCGNGVCLQRYTAQDFFILKGGEKVGSITVSAGIETQIGYHVFPAFRGKGVATAAVKTLTDLILASGNVQRVVARTHVDNRASLRVLEKSGYHLMERLVDTLVYVRSGS